MKINHAKLLKFLILMGMSSFFSTPIVWPDLLSPDVRNPDVIIRTDFKCKQNAEIETLAPRTTWTSTLISIPTYAELVNISQNHFGLHSGNDKTSPSQRIRSYVPLPKTTSYFTSKLKVESEKLEEITPRGSPLRQHKSDSIGNLFTLVDFARIIPDSLKLTQNINLLKELPKITSDTAAPARPRGVRVSN